MSNTNTSTKSKAAALARVQALMAGTLKHFPNASFTLGNETFTTASLILVLKSLADAMSALSAAQKSAKDALAAEQGTKTKVGPILQAYLRFILAAFSNATLTLADFGLTPPKARTPLTTEQMAAAKAKAAATRLARGTASKKKKATVKGNVTGITVIPITAPTAAPPAAPALAVTLAPASPVPPVTPAPPAEPVSPVTPASPSAQPAPTASSTPSTGTATK